MSSPINDPEIEAYALEMTTPQSQHVAAIHQQTITLPGSQMLSDRLVGQFLAMLVKFSEAKIIFEIGTFTGYSALTMAEALPDEGRLYTCEINQESFERAKAAFTQSPDGRKIIPLLGPAETFIDKFDKTIDLAFIDANKKATRDDYEALLPKMRQGGIIVVDNVLWKAQVILEEKDENAKAMDAFNRFIVTDSRVENVLLPVRDGLNVIRKK